MGLRGDKGGGGVVPLNIHCALTSGGSLGKAHYEHCSTSPVLTEVRDQDVIKAIADYA